jgi:hypothetical protein
MRRWNYQNPGNRSLACALLCHRVRMNSFEPEHNFSIDRNLRGIFFCREKFFRKPYHSDEIIFGLGVHNRTNKVRKSYEQLKTE